MPNEVIQDSHGAHLKCVVWDLDGTLWDGVLLENPDVMERAAAATLVRQLDARGVVQSVASRNSFSQAKHTLMRLGLWDFFVTPRITFSEKTDSIEAIARDLGFPLDVVGFVDDDQYERERVTALLPSVRCYDAHLVEDLARRPEFQGGRDVSTIESRSRRIMYQADVSRRSEERRAESEDAFLSSLGMLLTIREATPDDLNRVEELMLRTNQLNSTGIVYSREEIVEGMTSGRLTVLLAELEDRFGSQGRVGVCVLRRDEGIWFVDVFLVSCRVAARGIATVLLHYLMDRARSMGVVLRAVFVPTESNRAMLVALRLAGFIHDSDEMAYLTAPRSPGGVARNRYVAIRDCWSG